MSTLLLGPRMTAHRRLLLLAESRHPKYLYKLIYDEASGRAWAHWIENTDEARVGRPISYEELVQRTGIAFLPGAAVRR
jgi:endonuclease G